MKKKNEVLKKWTFSLGEGILIPTISWLQGKSSKHKNINFNWLPIYHTCSTVLASGEIIRLLRVQTMYFLQM